MVVFGMVIQNAVKENLNREQMLLIGKIKLIGICGAIRDVFLN